jgi:hypothetical protein
MVENPLPKWVGLPYHLNCFLIKSIFWEKSYQIQTEFFRIVVAANFQEAILQIHFHPNDDESLQMVENPSVKEVDLANLQRILQTK